MTIAYRGGGQNASSSADTTNVSMSATAQSGDYLIATCAWDSSSGTVTWPSGFTQRGILNSTVNGGSSAWADKIAGGSEPSSYTISENSGSTSIAAGVVAYSVVDNTTPRDVTPTALLSGSASDPWSVIATGVATGTANRFLVWIGSCDQNGGGTVTSSPPSASPATWTERVDVSDTVWSNVAICDCLDVAGTYTSNVTGVQTSATSTTAGRMGYLIALRPDTGGGDTQAATTGIFDPDWYADAWFDTDSIAAAWFDTDWIEVSTGGAVTHSTSGTITGQGSSISGTAAHKAKHTSNGILVGQGSTITGTASRYRLHASSGALVGQSSVITGTALRYRFHTSSGVIVGQGSVVSGTSRRYRLYSTSGVLTGQGATIAGTAAHRVKHTTSGSLAGQTSLITGNAVRFRLFSTTGILSGQGSVVSGTANRIDGTGGPVTHSATGVLSGQGSIVSGTSVHRVKHSTSGVLSGQNSIIAGSSRRWATHSASGVLSGQLAIISASATHKAKHTTSGILIGDGAVIVGSASLTSSTIIIDGIGISLEGAFKDNKLHYEFNKNSLKYNIDESKLDYEFPLQLIDYSISYNKLDYEVLK